jgi:hypothetical protein
MAVYVEGIEDVSRGFREILGKFSNPDTRRRIALAGAPNVVSSIQGITPVSKREHKRYDTPKLVNKLRAPKGLGRVAATYLPGNLKNAVMNLADRRKKFAKSPSVVIAPLYSRSKAKVVGRGKSVDAYYAHMVYGSAEAYQKKILISGLRIASSGALSNMINEATKVLEEEKHKTGL